MNVFAYWNADKIVLRMYKARQVDHSSAPGLTAMVEQLSANALVTRIAERRAASSLTAAVRVFIVSYFRAAATDDGHRKAGHGRS